MTMENVIVTIRNELIRSVSGLDAWFDKEDVLMDHKPSSWDRSVREVLEAVMLTNRFLLSYIDKGSSKAIIQSGSSDDFTVLLNNYCLENTALSDSGIHQTFDLTQKDRIKPSGKVQLAETRREIREQLDRCLIHLELLRNGEGILYKTGMSVDGLGELDVYQHIYFLALHIKRHLYQLEQILEDKDKAFENV